MRKSIGVHVYVCNTFAIRVQYVCNTCAIRVHYVCNTCAIRVQYVCNTCAIHVQYVCNTYGRQLQAGYKAQLAAAPLFNDVQKLSEERVLQCSSVTLYSYMT
jgi:hypothetical protein